MLRTALVTGASAGLGRELVRQLVRDRGLTVLATARSLDRLESLAAELPEGRVRFLAGDLADADFRAQLWTWAEATSGGLDLLVNNAGFGDYNEFVEQDFGVIEQMVEVNLLALCDLTQRALRHMKARGGGQILEISSFLGFFGMPYSAAYVATKHAVNGLVKSLRYELRGTGVRVWAACPGRTESEFFRRAVGTSGANASPSTGPLSRGEPTDRVARGILRGLDRRVTLLIPTLSARALAGVAHRLPWLFDWVMERWVRNAFSREITEARRDQNPSAP
jgi:uncharacterized protein